MPIPLQCPACGKKSQVPDEFQGRSVRCPSCQHKFKVPIPATMLVEARATQQRAAPERTVGPAASMASSRPPDVHGADVPAQVGRFVIQGKLGAGAFGAVYRALDPHLQREVALKVPKQGLLDDPKLVERFLREGKAAAGLRHPHIVPVYDAGRDGELYYLAAAFIPGRTLAKAIDRQGMEPRRAAALVRDLAEALGYAHDQGVVHRDVKPANVMLDEQGEAHLTDFGLAYRQEAAEKLTQDGAVMGTPAYMAPEMAEGQQGEPQPASDQYSLGVTLYELLTGRTPFSGPVLAVLYAVTHREPEAPRRLNPSIPADLETICLKALAKQPEQRYASCQELADDLRRWLEGGPIRARRLGVSERVVRWVKRKPRVAGLAAVTVGCLLAVSVVAAGKVRALSETEATTAALLAEARDKASLARQKAAEAAKQAAAAKRDAELSRQKQREADKQRGVAAQAAARRQADAEKANQVRKEVEKKNLEARKVLYRACLERARQALRAGNVSQARTLLARYQPGTGSKDLRDEQWQALWQRLDLPPLDEMRHTSTVLSLAFSPDGKMLASGSQDGFVKLWDVASGAKLRSLRALNNPVRCLAFSPDGKTLAAGYDYYTPPVIPRPPGPAMGLAPQTGKDEFLTTSPLFWLTATVTTLTLAPDAAADKKKTESDQPFGALVLWELGSGGELMFRRWRLQGVNALAFAPDGKTLATRGSRFDVKNESRNPESRLWDVVSRQERTTSISSQQFLAYFTSTSGNGKTLLTVGWHHQKGSRSAGRETASGYRPELQLRDVLTGKSRSIVIDVPLTQSWRSAVASPDGNTAVFVTGTAPEMGLWSVPSDPEQPPKRRLTAQGIYTVSFSPDGKFLATGGTDGRVRLWDVAKGKERTPLD